MLKDMAGCSISCSHRQSWSGGGGDMCVLEVAGMEIMGTPFVRCVGAVFSDGD
jgi:hypothetical protein